MNQSPAGLLAEAFSHHQAGRGAEAERLYRQILTVDPREPDALHLFGLLATQHGQHEAAVALISQAIAIRSDRPSFYNSLGSALVALGRREEAIAAYERGLALAPNAAELHNNLGNVLLADGRFEDAVASYRAALAAGGDNSDILNNLGRALRSAGRVTEAIAAYENALALKPDDAELRNNLGSAFVAAGDLEGALGAFLGAAAGTPASADIQHNLGSVLARLDRLDEAAAAFSRALAINPAFADAHNALGYTQFRQGKTVEAIACYERALAVDPENADAYNNLGFAYEILGRAKDAQGAYERALAIRPDFAEAFNNLGNVLKEQGEFAAAKAAYERAAEADPKVTMARFNRAELTTFRRGDAEIESLGLLIQEGLPPERALYIHFALAKALDDVGEYDAAFAELARGNSLKRAQVSFDGERNAAYFASIAGTFPRKMFKDLPEGQSGGPGTIFIIGMPRSGSTLIEQIFASHAEVDAVGESTAFDQAVHRAFDLESRRAPFDYESQMPKLDADRLARIAADYHRLSPPLAAGKSVRVDKLPGNFLHIGLIRLALPSARIIHSTRDAMDTGFSCFSKLFREGHEFSYDLRELGNYHRAYAGVMAHWQSVLPENAILNVAYEDVVADLEGVARRILSHCDLPWDERCLSFHTTRRNIATASALQVRRPLYRSAVGRWRHYAAHLAPLAQALRPK